MKPNGPTKPHQRKRNGAHIYERLLDAFASEKYGENWRDAIGIDQARREYAEALADGAANIKEQNANE